jgi:hypothetical protein
MVRTPALALALLLASPASAESYDWHAASNRLQIATIFEAAGKACSQLFGFTALPVQPRAAMAEKIDAYLLLRDDPEAELRAWIGIFQPPLEIASDKPSRATDDDTTRGAASLVAAAKDPSLMAEAERRYVESAMAPFRRALTACDAGTRDPFLGKNYWTGTGSTADTEATFRKDFAEDVAALRRRKKN